MTTWWHYFIICAIALAVTAAAVPLVRRLALRLDAVDYPGPRRVNKKPIPRMGGIAMFAGVVVALVVEVIADATGVWDGPIIHDGEFSMNMLGVLGGLLLIVAIGAVDDVKSLPPAVKFAGQIAAACVIAFTGTLLSSFKIPFSNEVVRLDWVAYPVTIIYLVSFANIINLIDGLDGLAAGISGIAAFSLFVLMVGLNHDDAAMLAVILVGICVGFLFYNFSPASIFMGDSGSLLLGLMLGTISLVGASRFASVTALLVPIVIAGIPVLDTFSAIVRRLRGHQRIDTADAGHIHHRLLRRGFSQRKAVFIIYLWTALLCIGAAYIWSAGGVAKYTVLVVMVVVSVFIVWYLGLFGPVLQHHFGDGDRIEKLQKKKRPKGKDKESAAGKPKGKKQG